MSSQESRQTTTPWVNSLTRLAAQPTLSEKSSGFDRRPPTSRKSRRQLRRISKMTSHDASDFLRWRTKSPLAGHGLRASIRSLRNSSATSEKHLAPSAWPSMSAGLIARHELIIVPGQTIPRSLISPDASYVACAYRTPTPHLVPAGSIPCSIGNDSWRTLSLKKFPCT